MTRLEGVGGGGGPFFFGGGCGTCLSSWWLYSVSCLDKGGVGGGWGCCLPGTFGGPLFYTAGGGGGGGGGGGVLTGILCPPLESSSTVIEVSCCWGFGGGGGGCVFLTGVGGALFKIDYLYCSGYSSGAWMLAWLMTFLLETGGGGGVFKFFLTGGGCGRSGCCLGTLSYGENPEEDWGSSYLRFGGPGGGGGWFALCGWGWGYSSLWGGNMPFFGLGWWLCGSVFFWITFLSIFLGCITGNTIGLKLTLLLYFSNSGVVLTK